ncbi:hypothetical protein PCH_Pc22g22300 [Penicillium rubens Wisconsin 54-1255]|uniref:Uncharacterized protein n=1 Tax=Penicillium rubens (strain ATCC 28089 / DSM 1075 / NRRL 1951 / Wisconsin 54-1255) TaxID=500485 RepID=B6HU68_PENRW|nr:hypothetical protein PCH_Pc22g22300 [Penicillium rubens Wisconsin 54-1255]
MAEVARVSLDGEWWMGGLKVIIGTSATSRLSCSKDLGNSRLNPQISTLFHPNDIDGVGLPLYNIPTPHAPITPRLLLSPGNTDPPTARDMNASITSNFIREPRFRGNNRTPSNATDAPSEPANMQQYAMSHDMHATPCAG